MATESAHSANITRVAENAWALAHNDSVYVQDLVPCLNLNWQRATFVYRPCWVKLDPGMELEAHSHPIFEYYVFTSGTGKMHLNEKWFDVGPGMVVNVPPDAVHGAKVDKNASEPLVWISTGFSVAEK
jgi:mannose-6-phosphate isomerase-like protein (cupin superfamily)